MEVIRSNKMYAFSKKDCKLYNKYCIL